MCGEGMRERCTAGGAGCEVREGGAAQPSCRFPCRTPHRRARRAAPTRAPGAMPIASASRWSALAMDARAALRALVRRPLFAGTAVLALALGLAATTAVTGVVD